MNCMEKMYPGDCGIETFKNRMFWEEISHAGIQEQGNNEIWN